MKNNITSYRTKILKNFLQTIVEENMYNESETRESIQVILNTEFAFPIDVFEHNSNYKNFEGNISYIDIDNLYKSLYIRITYTKYK